MKRALALGLSLALSISCRESRPHSEPPTSFASVQPTIARACSTCHAGAEAAAGYHTTSYLELLGCTKSGTPATLPHDAGAPFIAVLARPDHAALVDAGEQTALLTWVEAHTPGNAGMVHGLDILNPRSDGWHGRLASERGYAPLRVAEDDAACGRCHDGAPVRPAGVSFAAPGAPACTSCHAQPNGVLACSTCHGQAARSYPPRDPCYFVGAVGGAHASHVDAPDFRAYGFDCATCHPAPGVDVLAGAHANGVVDVAFSPLAGTAPEFSEESGSCSVACHARGGEQPQPTWTSALTLDCNGCHLSPPPAHYPGVCSSCHAEMGDNASALLPGTLHINGVVDLGSGDGTCGACHGESADPWPRDELHGRHRDSTLTSPIDCSSCHSVPPMLNAVGHLDGIVSVQFSGRALLAGSEPSFDTVSKGCVDVACHAGPLRNPVAVPRWLASTVAPDACTSCHLTPPAPPHVQQPSCGGGLCHGSEVSGAAPMLGITANGRALHVDGLLQAGSP